MPDRAWLSAIRLRSYSAEVFSRVVAACSHIFVLVCTQSKVQEFLLPSERKRLLYPSAWDRQLKHLSVNERTDEHRLSVLRAKQSHCVHPFRPAAAQIQPFPFSRVNQTC